MRDAVIERFPPDYVRYIEVFGGAGWVLFHKPPGPFDVYNDYDSDLTNLYRCVRANPGKLKHKLRYMINSHEDFAVMLEQRKRGLFRRFRDYDRASKFYALLWYSYGYMMKAFGNKPHSMWSHFPLIDQAAERLQSVVVENRDFADLVRIYDRPDSFFYCDPPYYRSEYFYKSGAPVTDCFSTADHLRFRDAMMRCDGKFLISYNDCPEVRELWDMPGIYIQKISRPHNLMLRYQLGEKYKELFISNYDTRERQRTFQQLSLLDE